VKDRAPATTGAPDELRRRTRLELAVAAAAVGGLVAYVAYRAWALSFTHDESLTYALVPRSVGDLVRYEGMAAHHLVSTLLMKAADATVGPSETALRAGSVAAGAVYLIVLVLWTAELQSRALAATAVVLAGANPFVLDFLSLARGYALVLAGTAAAALFAVRYARRLRTRWALAALLAAAVATVSQFTVLAFFVSLCAALLGFALVAWRRSLLTGSSVAGVLVAIGGVGSALAAAVAPAIVRLRDANELTAGTDSLGETFKGMLEGSLYGEWSSWVEIAVGAATLVLLGTALAVATYSAFRASEIPPPSAMLGALVVLPVAAWVVPHHVFDLPYPLGRHAIFLIPLVVMCACTAADELLAGARSAVNAGAAVIAAAAAVNFAATANVSFTYDWRYDADTERIATRLEEVTAGDPRARVGATWLLEPTLNFYRVSKDLELTEITDDCRGDCLLEDYDWYVSVAASTGLAEGERGGVAVERYRTSEAVLLRVPRHDRPPPP
jgi:hypothetical protein